MMAQAKVRLGDSHPIKSLRDKLEESKGGGGFESLPGHKD